MSPQLWDTYKTMKIEKANGEFVLKIAIKAKYVYFGFQVNKLHKLLLRMQTAVICMYNG